MTVICPKCQLSNLDTSRFCADCGTRLGSSETSLEDSMTRTMEAPVAGIPSGTIFAGRYEIIEELGAGGMGRVYKVFDSDIKEKIALKLLRPEVAQDRGMIERFSNELRLARKISHRNVCRMFDLGKVEGTIFITMEYVAGEDLKKLIRKTGNLEAIRAVSVAKQICEGLMEAHHLGVIHRDLKPQNIMMDEDGNVRIMDFGIARSLRSKGITGVGVMIGTPEYMSPEQAEGKEADQRSDIYSLGIVLYEMVAGRPPFDGETAFSIALKHTNELPADPRRSNPQIPESLSRIILRCLEKNRDARYQSVEALRSELAAVEEELSAKAGILITKRALSREAAINFSPRKLLFPAVILFAVITTGILLWRPWSRKTAFPVAPAGKLALAVLPFTNNTGDQRLDVWKIALADLLVDNLTQSKFIYILPKDRMRMLINEFGPMEANGYSAENLKKLAARGVGRYILVGSFFKSGQNWQVNVTLKKADTGEDEKVVTAKREGENPLLDLADILTNKIKRVLPLSGQQLADDAASIVGNVTTSSPDAYACFSQGFGYYSEMAYQKAIPLLERAVEIDPEFAMAWRTLAAIYLNSRNRKFKDNYKNAFDLSEKLPPRERYLIQAEYYTNVDNNLEKALETADKLLKDYPEDLLGNRTKYNIFKKKQIEWKTLVELSETNYRLFPENALECGNYIMFLCASGNLQKAKEIARNFLENYTDNVSTRRQLWLTEACLGEFDLALSAREEAFRRFPTGQGDWYWILAKGDLYRYKGDLDKAEQEYLKLARSEVPGDKIRGNYALNQLSSQQGQFGKSRKILEVLRGLETKTETKEDDAGSSIEFAYLSFLKGEAQDTLRNADEALRIGADDLDVNYKYYVLVYKGWAQARLRAFAEAEKTADQIKSIANETRSIYWYHLLKGWIEIERGQYGKALPDLERASFLYAKYDVYGGGLWDDRAFIIYPLALAYEKAGDLDKAIATCQEITRMTLGRRASGVIYAKAFYMLGKIYEKKIDKVRAVESYRKFLDLWKDADPGLPEVEDATKRIAALK